MFKTLLLFNCQDEVVIALSWAVKISQNYKEKIQCLLGLKRISARAMLGTSMNTVLSNICLAVEGYPFTDNEMKERFEMEASKILI